MDCVSTSELAAGSTDCLTPEVLLKRQEVPRWMTVPKGEYREYLRQRTMAAGSRLAFIEGSQELLEAYQESVSKMTAAQLQEEKEKHSMSTAKLHAGATELLTLEVLSSRQSVPTWMTLPHGEQRELARSYTLIVSRRLAMLDETQHEKLKLEAYKALVETMGVEQLEEQLGFCSVSTSRLQVGMTECLTADVLAKRKQVPLWMTLPAGPRRESARAKTIVIKQRLAYIEEGQDGP